MGLGGAEIGVSFPEKLTPLVFYLGPAYNRGATTVPPFVVYLDADHKTLSSCDCPPSSPLTTIMAQNLRGFRAGTSKHVGV